MSETSEDTTIHLTYLADGTAQAEKEEKAPEQLHDDNAKWIYESDPKKDSIAHLRHVEEWVPIVTVELSLAGPCCQAP